MKIIKRGYEWNTAHPSANSITHSDCIQLLNDSSGDVYMRTYSNGPGFGIQKRGNRPSEGQKCYFVNLATGRIQMISIDSPVKRVNAVVYLEEE